MYVQLRTGNAEGMVSWRRMFDFVLQICQLYSDIEADTRVTPPPPPPTAHPALPARGRLFVCRPPQLERVLRNEVREPQTQFCQAAAPLCQCITYS